MAAKSVKRKAAATSKAAKLPVRAKSSEPAQADSEPVKGTMMVFDDNDDDDEGDQIVSTTLSAVEKPGPREIPDSEGDEVSDDDNDEAPEAVSTQNITSNAEQLAVAASKAAQELAAAQKRKRQERDALFKKQATSRKSKPSSTEAEESAASSKSNQTTVPTLLPDEFLTDESESESDAESYGGLDERPKRRRVANVERTLTRLDRGPADERVGSTLFTVAKVKTDPRLPPKMNKNAKHRKDALLQRKRVPVQSKGKFFRK